MDIKFSIKEKKDISHMKENLARFVEELPSDEKKINIIINPGLPDNVSPHYVYNEILLKIREELRILDERGVILTIHCLHPYGMSVTNRIDVVDKMRIFYNQIMQTRLGN